ncbi:hypothetical protein BwSF19_73310 [Bradyrhizobium ottawaense]|nr:hypothetical protein BwSF19_73310 [Bradyrhizobium ottawaense]
MHMTEMEAHRFREEAGQCRVLAAQAVSSIDREAWLRLAEDWEKLADKAAKRHGFLIKVVICACPVIFTAIDQAGLWRLRMG